jgi:hypothetical protein
VTDTVPLVPWVTESMVSVSSLSAAMSLAVTSISTEPPLVASLESSTATGTLLTAAVGVGSGGSYR